MATGSKDWYAPQTGLIANEIRNGNCTDDEYRLYTAVSGYNFYLTSVWININNGSGAMEYGKVFLKTGAGSTKHAIIQMYVMGGESNNLAISLNKAFLLPTGYEIFLKSNALNVLVSGGLTGYEQKA